MGHFFQDFVNNQITDGAGRLLSSTLPRQALHEAASYRCDDDDADKQGWRDANHQRDEEEVSSWGEQEMRESSAVI